MGKEAARDRLVEIDPKAEEVLDMANPRRVERAVEVYELTGLTPTARAAQPTAQAVADYRSVTPFTAVGVDPGPELARRIGNRLQEMMSAGFLDELARLEGSLGPTSSEAVGYKQLLPVVRGVLSEAEGTEQAVRATMSLAKRQRTYFRRDPRIEWVPWSGDPSERYELVKRSLTERV
jgi:tRNA dimethylallyltransferase